MAIDAARAGRRRGRCGHPTRLGRRRRARRARAHGSRGAARGRGRGRRGSAARGRPRPRTAGDLGVPRPGTGRGRALWRFRPAQRRRGHRRAPADPAHPRGGSGGEWRCGRRARLRHRSEAPIAARREGRLGADGPGPVASATPTTCSLRSARSSRGRRSSGSSRCRRTSTPRSRVRSRTTKGARRSSSAGTWPSCGHALLRSRRATPTRGTGGG